MAANEHVQYNCGCGFTESTSQDAKAHSKALKHVETTGHAVTVLGIIRPVNSKKK